MERADLPELHCIMPISNLPSIMQRGILCHRQAQRLDHDSVAMDEIQERRSRVRVPGGLRLHDYANLYITARNPMLFLRKSKHAELCVLSVRCDVLDIPGVVVTDRNASADYCQFAPAPEGLAIVNKDLTFAEYWTHPDTFEYWRRKSAKQAEVLVPNRVPPDYIRGAYVSGRDGRARVRIAVNGLKTAIHPRLFFLPSQP